VVSNGWKESLLKVGRWMEGLFNKPFPSISFEKDKAHISKKGITLPEDVPTGMFMAIKGVLYHEAEHWVSDDLKWSRRYPSTLSYPLNVVQDVRCDHRAIGRHCDGEEAYVGQVDYIDRKITPKERMKQPMSHQVCVELIFRGYPHSVGRGKGTQNPLVQHWFKQNPKWRKCIGECQNVKDNDSGRKTLVRWAKWLIEKVYQDQTPEGLDPDELAKFLKEKADGDGGMLPKEFGGGPEGDEEGEEGEDNEAGNSSRFDGLDPYDLHCPKMKAKTVDILADFLKEFMDEVTRDETGRINPRKLPSYWRNPSDFFQVEEERKQKKVKVYIAADCSLSTKTPLPDNSPTYEAIAKGTAMMCNAVDRVYHEHGLEVESQVYCFAGGFEVI